MNPENSLRLDSINSPRGSVVGTAGLYPFRSEITRSPVPQKCSPPTLETSVSRHDVIEHRIPECAQQFLLEYPFAVLRLEEPARHLQSKSWR